MSLRLAIETTSRHGAVSLGAGDALWGTAALAQRRRHNTELLPAIDRICAAHGVGPGDLAEVAVSVGPGSFTGLRVAVAAAQMLGRGLGARTIPVPTLSAVAQNAPAPPETAEPLVVALALKGERVYAAPFRYDGSAGRWRPDGAGELTTLGAIAGWTPAPATVLGDPLPEGASTRFALRPAAEAIPDSAWVWRLGAEHPACPPAELLPIYARRPEAEELWEKRRGEKG